MSRFLSWVGTVFCRCRWWLGRGLRGWCVGRGMFLWSRRWRGWRGWLGLLVGVLVLIRVWGRWWRRRLCVGWVRWLVGVGWLVSSIRRW